MNDKLTFEKSLSSIEIIEALRDKSFDMNPNETLEDYLKSLAQSLWKFQRQGLQVPENVTLDEKCKSVIDQLIKFNLIEII